MTPPQPTGRSSAAAQKRKSADASKPASTTLSARLPGGGNAACAAKATAADGTPICSRAEAEIVCCSIQELKGELDKLHARRADIILKHEARLKLPDDLTARIPVIEEQIAACGERLVDWAKKNRKEFGDAKTMEIVPGGTIEFRTGNRKVELIEDGKAPEKGWDWKAALGAMLKNLGKWRRCIIRPPEISRKAILELTKDKSASGKPIKPKLTSKDLAEVGLCVKQEESWSLEVLSAAEVRVGSASQTGATAAKQQQQS